MTERKTTDWLPRIEGLYDLLLPDLEEFEDGSKKISQAVAVLQDIRELPTPPDGWRWEMAPRMVEINPKNVGGHGINPPDYSGAKVRSAGEA